MKKNNPLTKQQSLKRLASRVVVKFKPHSYSCRASLQCTKHSLACVILVPIKIKKLVRTSLYYFPFFFFSFVTNAI